MHLAHLTWPEIGAAAPRTVAVLPIAAIEQHGHHLAVSTDTAIVTAVAEGLERARPELVMLCPTQAYGSSHHHRGFPGTMTLSHDTFVRVLKDLVESLLRAGFRRLILLNGHGGNRAPGNYALQILSHEWDDRCQPNLALATYWDLAGNAFRGGAPLETPAISHACEYETSAMLHLHPERVRPALAGPASHPADHPPYRQWQVDLPSPAGMTKTFHHLSDKGSMGSPQLATAAKGAHLVQAAIAGAVAFVDDFATWPMQHDRRPDPGIAGA